MPNDSRRLLSRRTVERHSMLQVQGRRRVRLQDPIHLHRQLHMGLQMLGKLLENANKIQHV